MHGKIQEQQWRSATLVVATRRWSLLNFTWPWLEKRSVVMGGDRSTVYLALEILI